MDLFLLPLSDEVLSLNFGAKKTRIEFRSILFPHVKPNRTILGITTYLVVFSARANNDRSTEARNTYIHAMQLSIGHGPGQKVIFPFKISTFKNVSILTPFLLLKQLAKIFNIFRKKYKLHTVCRSVGY